MPDTAREQRQLELAIDIAARPETVFRFLTDADAFQQWMGAQSRLDPASRAVSVTYPNGDEVIGQLIEADAPRRVVYSWGYRGDKHGLAPNSTKVVIELTPTRDGTHLVLRHEGLDAAAKRNHEMGWQYYIGQLGAAAASAQVAPAIDATMNDYVLAWNTDDPAERGAALRRSCEASVVYQDRMAYTTGADALLTHITGARAFAPGVRLVVPAAPARVHQHVRYDWQIVGEADRVFATGVGFGRLSLDGRFLHVVSFWNG